VNCYHFALRYNPEDSHLHTRRCENQRFYLRVRSIDVGAVSCHVWGGLVGRMWWHVDAALCCLLYWSYCFMQLIHTHLEFQRSQL
jgi:hypothetical protein